MKQLFFLILCLLAESIQATIHEPYKQVTATIRNAPVAYSPDPLSGYRWDNPKATDDLEIYTIYPKKIFSDETGNFCANSDLSSIHVIGDCSLQFDFGQVNAGWLEFDSDNLVADVKMSISEYNEPAFFNLGSQHPIKTAKPIRYGNSYRLELNKELYEGVRFGWIHIRKLNQPADISNIRLVCQVKPTNYEGSFSCSDTTLTRIWYTGAYTVKLNLLKDYFGAILMERSDRHSWTGDAHTSQAASLVAFGNFDFVKTNLIYTSTQYNGIASYSLYWILSLIDYFNYTGDADFVRSLLNNACQKLDAAYEHYGKNPSISFAGWDERLGAGFESPTQEAQYMYQMLSIQTWNKFGNMMSQIGQKKLAGKYKRYALEKIAELRKDPRWITRLGVHSAADAVNALFANEKELRQIWEIAFSDRMQRLSYSPFNQYFIICALANMRKHQEALNTVKDCWGSQLAYGGTTFFEVFRPSWNQISEPNDAPVNNQCGYTSLTHPWSAGVTKWISEEILGIKPSVPGFSECIIKPRLSDGLTWVEGSVPTPHGKIAVSFNSLTGESNISIPQGITAIVGFPKAGKTIRKIEMSSKYQKRLQEDNEFIYYKLTAGNYTTTIHYQDVLQGVKQAEPFTYPLQTEIREDVETQGNWPLKYGTAGYMLFNYDSVGTHIKKLPKYLENIVLSRNGNIHWSSTTTDIRALNAPEENAERKAGGIITNDPNVCQQTFTIDLKGKMEKKYSVSLYFLDWDAQNRRSAIEVFDYSTRELLLPVYMVRNYEKGKYITYTFDRPVRIRINHVRGANAALSGIFFD